MQKKNMLAACSMMMVGLFSTSAMASASAPKAPVAPTPSLSALFAMVDVPTSSYAGPPTSAVAVAPAPVAKPATSSIPWP